MVLVKELRPPRKMSGLSSFGIFFDYDPKLVEAVKSLPVRYWHAKERFWEIPSDCLAACLDSLTFCDDVRLTMLPDEVEEPSDVSSLTESEIEKFRFKPFAHQIEAIDFGLSAKHRKWLLLDSMGLGKTLEIIGLAETLKRRGEIDHCLVICGVDSLRQNWKREIKKFSTESCLVLGEKVSRNGKVSYATLTERAKILREPISEFFVIVNAATLRSDDIMAAFKKSKNEFGMIAVDEVHRFASSRSIQGDNLLKLQAKYQVAATGTLLINSPVSCYVPLS